MISDFGKLTLFEKGTLLTKLLICLILVNVVVWGSKPTGWDGDSVMPRFFRNHQNCSEPTVWDGDLCAISSLALLTRFFVLSPPCGMETGTA